MRDVNGKYTKRGYICKKKAKNCPTYKVSMPKSGSRTYNCGCAKGQSVHYYRDHNVFYKSCVTRKTKKGTRPQPPHRGPRVEPRV